jgi:hypothetical protein
LPSIVVVVVGVAAFDGSGGIWWHAGVCSCAALPLVVERRATEGGEYIDGDGFYSIFDILLFFFCLKELGTARGKNKSKG